MLNRRGPFGSLELGDTRQGESDWAPPVCLHMLQAHGCMPLCIRSTSYLACLCSRWLLRCSPISVQTFVFLFELSDTQVITITSYWRKYFVGLTEGTLSFLQLPRVLILFVGSDIICGTALACRSAVLCLERLAVIRLTRITGWTEFRAGGVAQQQHALL